MGWLKRSLEEASAEVASWPRWKRELEDAIKGENSMTEPAIDNSIEPRKGIVYPFPLLSFMAQFVLPQDLTEIEADRIIAFIKSVTAPVVLAEGVVLHDGQLD